MKTKNILLSAGLLIGGAAFLLMRKKSSQALTITPPIDPGQIYQPKDTIDKLQSSAITSILQRKDDVPIETTLAPTIVPQTVNTAPTNPAFQEALATPSLTVPEKSVPTSYKPSPLTLSTTVSIKPEIFR